jgi:hypothetical protein
MLQYSFKTAYNVWVTNVVVFIHKTSMVTIALFGKLKYRAQCRTL